MDGVDSREGFVFECGTCDLADGSLPSKGNTKAPRGRAACSRASSVLARFSMVLLYAGICAVFFLMHLRSRQRELPSP